MNPLEGIKKYQNGREAEFDSKVRGYGEVFFRSIFSPEIVDAFLDNPLFPGADADTLKTLKQTTNEAGLSVIDEEIRTRAEDARRKALNLKPMNVKIAKQVLKFNLDNYGTENLNYSQKQSVKRILNDALREGWIQDVIDTHPQILPLAREIIDQRGDLEEKYPYLLKSEKDRYRAGKNLVTKLPKDINPNLLRDPDIMQGYLENGGDKSLITNSLNRSWLATTEQQVSQNLNKNLDNKRVQAAINIGLRAINQEFTAKNFLTQQLIQLKGGELPISAITGISPNFVIRLNPKGCVDFKSYSEAQQGYLIKVLENQVLKSEFGTASSNPQKAIADIQSMSVAELAKTNIGAEIVHANGGDKFFTDYTPAEQYQILAQANSIRAVAYNYSRGLTGVLVENNSNVLSTGMKNGKQAIAVYLEAAKSVREATASNQFDSPELNKKLGAVSIVNKLQDVALRGVTKTSEVLPIPNIDDNFLINGSEKTRMANFRTISFALSQINSSDQTIQNQGIQTIQDKLKISYSGVMQLYLIMENLGKTEISTNYLTTDNQGNISIPHTISNYRNRADKIVQTANTVYQTALSKAKNEMLPGDFDRLAGNVDIEEIDYFQ